MKKTAAMLCTIFMALGVSVFYPVTAGCAMHGDDKGSGGATMQHEEGMKGGMSSPDDVMYHLKKMKEHMSAVMSKMASMLKEEAGKGKAGMRELMDDVCAQMGDINRMDEAGKGTKEEMDTMEQRKEHMDEMMDKMGSR